MNIKQYVVVSKIGTKEERIPSREVKAIVSALKGQYVEYVVR